MTEQIWWVPGIQFRFNPPHQPSKLNHRVKLEEEGEGKWETAKGNRGREKWKRRWTFLRDGKKRLKTILLLIKTKSKLKQAQKHRSSIFMPGCPLEYSHILNHDYAE